MVTESSVSFVSKVDEACMFHTRVDQQFSQTPYCVTVGDVVLGTQSKRRDNMMPNVSETLFKIFGAAKLTFCWSACLEFVCNNVFEPFLHDIFTTF